MNRYQKLVCALALALGLLPVASCSKGITGGDGPSPTPEKVAITGDYSDLRANAVTLYGWCNQKEEEGLSAVYGFEYSDTDLTTDARTVTAKSKTASNMYSYGLTNLKSGTKYYYRAYTKFNGTTSYGDVKTFTTATITASVTANSSNVKCITATISGKLTVESEGTFTKSAVLYYSSTASTLEALRSSGAKETLTLNPDGSYSIDLTYLSSGTQYSYVVIAKVDYDEFNTGVKSFKTLDITASVTAEPSNIKCGATISGKLSVEVKDDLWMLTKLYYSSTASTLEALKSSGVEKTLTMTADGEFSILIGALERETKYYCVVIAKVGDAEFSSSVISFKTTKPSCPSGAVDLGLSVCWATCNIGASKPEEYGGYYKWAGTEDVESNIYSLYNCPYHTGSDEEKGWTKYVPSDKESYWSGSGNPDNKTVLDPEDDVAHFKLGGKWRMPTVAEWEELLDNCTWTWTYNYNETQKEGRIVTSKRPGYTDRSIFLPAYFYSLNAYYWSSSLATNGPSSARSVHFDQQYKSTGARSRATGLFVRPVSD